MNAVLRAMTKLPEIRERSVVRSSVIPSAKYSWSGSFDRLLKGRTTIDTRGADLASAAGGRDALGAAEVWIDTSVRYPLGRAHQTAIPTPITATKLARRTASRDLLRRRDTPGCAGVETSGSNATAAAFMTKACTGCAMFLTLCSPMSSKA